jgi:hypothetical protein
MRPFVAWTLRQPREVYEQVLGHVQTICEVLANQRLVIGPVLVCPDYWAMAEAVAALQYLALEAGFVEAAQYCQQTYEEACAACAFVEILLGGRKGAGEGDLSR